MQPAVFDIAKNTPRRLVLRMRWFPPLSGMLGAILAAIPAIGVTTLLFPDSPLGQLLMMAMWCLAACMMVLNAESLTVTRESLTVGSEPIPWVPLRRTIPAATIQSVTYECAYLKGPRFYLRIFDAQMDSVVALNGIETEESCRAAAHLVVDWLNQNAGRDVRVQFVNPA